MRHDYWLESCGPERIHQRPPRRAVGPPGCHRLLPAGRPLEQLDGPEGVVREVGLAVLVCAGDA
jgi:hypothetical protein